MRSPSISPEISGRPVTRREALKTGLRWAGAAGLAGVTGCQTPLDTKVSRDFSKPLVKTGFIDAHVHVWTPLVEEYPLAPGFTPADMKPPSFTPEQIISTGEPVGVDRVVLIQMSYYGTDNSYMLDTIRQFPGVFRGVAIVDENSPDLTATLADLTSQGVRGLRITPGSQPVDAWIGSEGMDRLWALAGGAGIAMCPLINPEAIGAIGRMAEKHPETTVVIDHMARIGISGTIAEWDMNALCRLARFKNVHVKVSAFYALGQKKPPYADLLPLIDRVLSAFGPRRCMWASDAPFQVEGEHTYLDSLALIRDRIPFATESEKDWLLRKTAEKVFFS